MMSKRMLAPNVDAGLLLVRVALGVVFLLSGLAKFMAIAGTAKFFASIGLGIFWVYFVAAVEFFGGIALLLGICTEIAGWLLAINMAFAIFLVKFPMGFTAGYRLEFVLLLVSLGIALAGPGKYSLQRSNAEANK